MIKRKTQDISYWIHDFKIDEEEHEFIYDMLAESETPISTRQLVLALMQRRMKQEENFLRNELAKALIYDPKNHYKTGDIIYFPALDFKKGKVTDIRPGNNPEHGDFSVLTVLLEGEHKQRSFAADLQTPHRLNRTSDDNLLDDSDMLSAEALLEEAGDAVLSTVEQHLSENPDFFVRTGDSWLTTDQIVPVSIGHLNIAEALIEMKGSPVTTSELLEQVDLSSDLSKDLRIFSLKIALEQDDRFMQVGLGGHSAWYLRRLMPEAATQIPVILHYEPIDYDRSLLNSELLQTEYDLKDEWSDAPGPEEDASPQSAVFNLIYPHVRAGTMPLTPDIKKMIPASEGLVSVITLVDGRWGSKFPAWVMPEGRYIAGLGDWYKEHKLPVGTRIFLSLTNTPNEFLIDFKPHRARRHWLRLATVQGNKLIFQMQQKTMNVEVDDALVLAIGDPAAVEDLREHLEIENYDVRDIVAMLMPELVRMSPQGTTHVKTLYSATNLVRRLPPGPIFAALTQLPGAIDTGSGFWSL